jgi:hypothetical protein
MTDMFIQGRELVGHIRVTKVCKALSLFSFHDFYKLWLIANVVEIRISSEPFI